MRAKREQLQLLLRGAENNLQRVLEEHEGQDEYQDIQAASAEVALLNDDLRAMDLHRQLLADIERHPRRLRSRPRRAPAQPMPRHVSMPPHVYISTRPPMRPRRPRHVSRNNGHLN